MKIREKAQYWPTVPCTEILANNEADLVVIMPRVTQSVTAFASPNLPLFRASCLPDSTVRAQRPDFVQDFLSQVDLRTIPSLLANTQNLPRRMRKPSPQRADRADPGKSFIPQPVLDPQPILVICTSLSPQ